MIFTDTGLKGAWVIEPEPIEDSRGFFARMWCQKEFAEGGLETGFVQCNIAFNLDKGTLRGLHFQNHPCQEVKLVRCTRGEIFDVIVDLDPNSETYRKWFGIYLTEKNHKMLYVPKNCAHGYQTLCSASEVFYQVSEFYTPEAEGGLRWDDPDIGIQWPPTSRLTVSEKDRALPYLSEINYHARKRTMK
jgi:dTDP-4-dehydrorhamnose 3,5-epimerase